MGWRYAGIDWASETHDVLVADEDTLQQSNHPAGCP